MYRAGLLALLVLLAVPAVVTGLPDATMDETAVLTLEEPATDDRVVGAVDVGAAVALGGARGEARLERYTFEERLDTASDRPTVLRREANETAAEVDRLLKRTATARQAYAEGRMEGTAFLRELAILEVRAELLGSRVEQVRTAADELDGVSLREQLAGVSAGLVVVEGPVRQRAAAAMLGREEPILVSVSGSGSGEILAIVEDDRYRREATRIDHWTEGETERFGLDRAIARIQTLYPTAYNLSLQTGINVIGAGIYRVEMNLDRASIDAHLDGDTEQVFAEVQTRRLDDRQGGPATGVAENGTRLLVNRTIQGGPLRIATVANATGEPVPSTVVVDGVRFETGPDGVVWTVAPRRLRFTVTAITADGTVSTPVRSLEQTAVGD